MNINLQRMHFSEKIIHTERKMEESWRTIQQLLNKIAKPTNIDLISDKGAETITRKDNSNVMNKYLSSVGRELARKTDKCPNPLPSGEYDINPLKSIFVFSSIQAQHVSEAIGKIKSSKSFGDDNFSSYFLILAFPYFTNSLVLLFNTSSIPSCHFPDKWKIFRITPMFKEGDRACKENYRPISVLSVVTRLFEKLIFDQLYNYLNKNNLIYWGQSAYRKFHSTVTFLTKKHRQMV